MQQEDIDRLLSRLARVEKEIATLKADGYGRLIEIVAAKIDGDLSNYLPKVQSHYEDFEDFRLMMEDEFAKIKTAPPRAESVRTSQDSKKGEVKTGLELMRAELEVLKLEVLQTQTAKNSYSMQEVVKKVQANESDIRKVQYRLREMVPPERVDLVE